MDKTKINDYLKTRMLFTIPELQKKFSLNYNEIRAYIKELENESQLILKDELHYEYCEKDRESNLCPSKTISQINIDVLRYCVINKMVSTQLIQLKFNLSYRVANQIIKWMEENYYVAPSPNRKVLISYETFLHLYGDLEYNQGENTNKNDLTNQVSQKQKELKKRIKALEEKPQDEYIKNDMSSAALTMLKNKETEAFLKQLFSKKIFAKAQDVIDYLCSGCSIPNSIDINALIKDLSLISKRDFLMLRIYFI